jgi:hypothetical protein
MSNTEGNSNRFRTRVRTLNCPLCRRRRRIGVQGMRPLWNLVELKSGQRNNGRPAGISSGRARLRGTHLREMVFFPLFMRIFMTEAYNAACGCLFAFTGIRPCPGSLGLVAVAKLIARRNYAITTGGAGGRAPGWPLIPVPHRVWTLRDRN